MRNKLFLTLLISVFLIPALSFSQNISDYLILQDIGPYKVEAPQKVVGGYIGGPRVFDGAGVIALTGHFYPDHSDKTYEAYYEGGSTLSSPTVQITQHTGSDSDRWLLHEVERGFRSYYGLPGDSYVMRQIGGSTIMAAGSGGWTYRWINSNKVIQIAYTDLQMTKSEPLEVVRAYLAKHPSMLTSMTSAELRTDQNKTTWIKDEMERRLWLGEKWFAQLQVGNVELIKVLRQSVDHMNVFLDYREKYYGIASTPEKKSLWESLQAKDDTSIRNKLTEYKTWWNANKAGAINIP